MLRYETTHLDNTQFAVIRFEAKHHSDRRSVNIPGYDANNVTRSTSTTKYLYPMQ